MSFLTPDNLRWALIALLVLGFYLVRFGGRRQDVSAYLLWQRALARRSLWSRWWQRWVSLAVALVFAALLVLALTQPFLTGAVQRARSLVLIIDVSASMNATDVEPSRLARTKTFARQIVDCLEPAEQCALVSAGTCVDVQVGFTRDRERLRAAVDAVRAGEGPTRIDTAIALARRMTADHRNPQIVVLTDGAFAGTEQLARSEDVQLLVVAGSAKNLGITRLAIRAHPTNDPPAYETLVEVANFGSEQAECGLNVRLASGADPTGAAAEKPQRLTIAPGESVTRVVSVPGTTADLVVARLDVDDHLQADNRSQLLTTPLITHHVLVAANTNSPVARALASLPGSQVRAVESLPEKFDPATVAVLHGQVPAQLPLVPTLVVEPDAACDLWELDEAAGDLQRVSGGVTHTGNTPLLAGVDLSRVVCEEKIPLRVLGQAEALVTDQTELPLYLLLPRPAPAGPVLVLTVRLSEDKSDLTLRRDFPLLLANAVRWLGKHDQPVTGAATTSDLFALTPGASAHVLRSPDGRHTPLTAEQTLVGPLARGGVWCVLPEEAPPAAESTLDENAVRPTNDFAAARESAMAVSLVDRTESDIRPRIAVTEVLPAGLMAAGPSRPLWVWLLCLAMLITLAEWYLYHRRVLV